jgi:galactose dehydrogenase
MDEWGETTRAPLPVNFTDIAGKSVLITGGGSGIGAALTDGFLAQGARVSFVQRSDGSAFCDEMEAKHDSRPLFIPCDITDIAQLKAAVATAQDAHGKVQVLINNAANDTRHTTEDVTEEFWRWSSDINLKSYFFACQAVIAGMRERGGGAIINFSSVSYMMGMAGMPIYTASNAAITSLSHSLAREFGGDNIRVNSIAPGLVLTDRQKDLWLTPESVAEHVAQQCLHEVLVPEDIVGTALFLASDASRMMTGQSLIVDGGLVAP